MRASSYGCSILVRPGSSGVLSAVGARALRAHGLRAPMGQSCERGAASGHRIATSPDDGNAIASSQCWQRRKFPTPRRADVPPDNAQSCNGRAHALANSLRGHPERQAGPWPGQRVMPPITANRAVRQVSTDADGPAGRTTPIRRSTSCPTAKNGATIWSGESVRPHRREHGDLPAI